MRFVRFRLLQCFAASAITLCAIAGCGDDKAASEKAVTDGATETRTEETSPNVSVSEKSFAEFRSEVIASAGKPVVVDLWAMW